MSSEVIALVSLLLLQSTAVCVVVYRLCARITDAKGGAVDLYRDAAKRLIDQNAATSRAATDGMADLFTAALGVLQGQTAITAKLADVVGRDYARQPMQYLGMLLRGAGYPAPPTPADPSMPEYPGAAEPAEPPAPRTIPPHVM